MLFYLGNKYNFSDQFINALILGVITLEDIIYFSSQIRNNKIKTVYLYTPR